MRIVPIILLLIVSLLTSPALATEIPWKVFDLISKGRIDAIADLGNGIIVIGTRNTNPAFCFKSIDYGLTWKKVAAIESSEKRAGVTCIQSGGEGICYLLNESSEFFRSLDYGETWRKISKLSTGSNDQGFALSYGICVTNQGTLLVSDSNSSGGSIYRSTDKGLSFSKIKFVSPEGLYRFTLLKKCIIVNGWEGVVYCSKDDGLTWAKLAVADQSPLFATESIGANEYLQGTLTGNIYSGDTGTKSPKYLAKPGGAADDFVYAGYGTVIYSTYTGSQSVFISYDKGNSWIDDGVIPTGKNKDWLDHVIRVEKKDSVVILGGTNKGSIVRASFLKDFLKQKQREYRR